MKYYDGHEQEYQRRLNAGQLAWDAGEYDTFDMLPFVQNLLGKNDFSSTMPRGLDLGCGTGALACWLAARGFDMTGMDIASSAIAMAKKQAAQRELAIDFRVADLCDAQLPADAFDVITDNHFLHCIVFDDQRQGVLQKVCRALKAEGQYWIETMVGHPEMTPQDEWNMDAQGITWVGVNHDVTMDRAVMKDDKTWIPIRRIQPSSAVLIDELRQAGLEVLGHETVAPRDQKDTGTFRGRCRRRQSLSG